MKTVVGMFIALTAIAASAVAVGQTVTLTGGQIQGAMFDKGGAVFKGISMHSLRWVSCAGTSRCR
jgi:hypothetical protein